MNLDEHQSEGKKGYQAPKLAIISLRPEEAVLGHCKSLTGGANFTVFGCTPIGACNSIGS